MPYMRREGLEIYYEVAGQGPPVLLIQGVGVIGEGWRPQMQGLAKDFQLVAFDNQGIGKSVLGGHPLRVEGMAKVCQLLMDELGWQAAHVVGHSLGGVIAQQLALDCPKRVKSLSLLCTFAGGCDGARVTPKVLWLGLRTRIGSKAMRRRAFLEILMPKAALANRNIPETAEAMAKLIGRDLAESPPILMQQLQALSRHNCYERLGQLGAIPCLVLSASADPIALPAYGKTLAAAIPGARYVELPNAAHGVTIEQADKVNALLREFFLHSPPKPN